MNEIRALTALRGIFAMWVLGYHLRSLHPVPMPDPHGFLLRGYLGVDFFFLLSGFVLARAYGDRVSTTASYRRFVTKRALRLFPLHLVVLAISAVTIAAFGRWPGFRQLLLEATLIHRLPGVQSTNQSFNSPDWSISTEWIVNLLMPLIVLLVLKTSRLISVSSVLVSYSVLIWICATTGGSLDHSSANSYLPFLRCICEFSIGVSLCRWQTFGYRLPDAICLFAAFISTLFGLSDILIVPIFALSILALSAERGFAARALNWLPLYRLGEISFSIYLVHLPVLFVVRRAVVSANITGYAGLTTYVIGVVFITIMISWLSYSKVETYSRSLSDHFKLAVN
jgi:peptidoglycan/LPS O-acetylase OafA/YrhL